MQSLHHRLSWLILAPGILRSQLESFAKGEVASIDLLPQLWKVVVKFRFIPIIEREVEMMHSLIHRNVVMRKVGPAYVSLGLRMPEILAMMKHRWTEFLHLLELFSNLRKLPQFIKAFHLGLHPNIFAVRTGRLNVHNSSQWPMIADVFYGCDLVTKYATMKAAREAKKAAQKRLKTDAEKWLKAVPSVVGSGGVRSMRKSAMLEHLRAIAKENPHSIFAITRSAWSSHGAWGSTDTIHPHTMVPRSYGNPFGLVGLRPPYSLHSAAQKLDSTQTPRGLHSPSPHRHDAHGRLGMEPEQTKRGTKANTPMLFEGMSERLATPAASLKPSAQPAVACLELDHEQSSAGFSHWPSGPVIDHDMGPVAPTDQPHGPRRLAP